MPLAGDGVAGGVALVLLIAGLLVWFKLSRKRKATPRGKGFVKDTNFVAKYIQMNREKLMKMAGSVRTGGKGTMRRKKKAVHKSSTTDDKKLQSTLKRIGVNTIPAIEEVNIFKDDLVIQFVNPKVQASVVANTWVITGTPQTRKLQDILPGIINQLGPDNLDNLRKLAEQFQKEVPSGEAGAAQEDDDDVPELVGGETFETVAEEGQK
ncbi:basic transcription factor 3-like [Populus alba x Populus x berolinensis]|uniref:Nascent polypeptide-associated complex subunit beta n=1 Tax=Populus alba x Populus x berolinensis TaxID=444605 RepID=A0AAD6R208_9ROSI|nr:basic transcription factor 3-like [Populus alba x Populus x berolinensis]